MSQHGFAPADSNDHRAWLWVVSFLIPVYCFLALGARLLSKWQLLWIDDIVLSLAYVLAMAHWAIIYAAVSDGLGAAVSHMLGESALHRVSTLYFASRICLLSAIGLSKFATLLFTRRIFWNGASNQRLIFGFANAALAVWLVLAVLASSVGCDPTRAVLDGIEAECKVAAMRLGFITALDFFTEGILIAVPTILVRANTIAATKKRTVISAFCFRIFVPLLDLGATVAYLHFRNHGRPSIGLVPTLVWQEIWLGFSLISASIPCLRAFLWAFMSRDLYAQFGLSSMQPDAGPRTYPPNSGASIQLRSLTRRAKALDGVGPWGEGDGQLRPDKSDYAVRIDHGRAQKHHSVHEGRENVSVKSNESQQRIIGINRTVEVEVSRD